MGFTSGARHGELLKLRWKNINFNTAQAFCGDTKNGDNKILHLTPVIIAELKRIPDISKKSSSNITELTKVRDIGNSLIFIGQQGKLHTAYWK